jgi:putative hydrolase of HD superfamily
VQAPTHLAVLDCNCSICRKVAYLHLIVPQSQFRLLCGTEAIATYQFNTGAAKHMFCGHCGVKSFYVPRSHPDGYSVNARCLDDGTVETMTVTPFDGRDWKQAASGLRDGAADEANSRRKLSAIADFLIDLERLKLVSRRAYVSDFSRRENTAEHSWHLAIGLLAVARELNPTIDIHKALLMALVHDVCEIDAGDTPAYGAVRPDQHEAELHCIERLAAHQTRLAPELRELWLEFEAQQTPESRWVKVLDRLMPFIVNIATQGRNWQEQSVSRTQVLRISEPVREHAPQVYLWMRERIEVCVREGWLRDN